MPRTRANVFDVASGNLVQVGTNGVPRGGFNADKNNFAPRVGLAWTLGANERTVLRAGYGIYYDQSPLAPVRRSISIHRISTTTIFFSLPGLPLTLDNPFPQFFPFPLPDSALAIQRTCALPTCSTGISTSNNSLARTAFWKSPMSVPRGRSC